MFTNKNNPEITYVSTSASYYGREAENNQRVEFGAHVYVHGVPVCLLVADLYRRDNVRGSKKRWIVRGLEYLMGDIVPSDDELDAMLAEINIEPDMLAIEEAEPFDVTPSEPVEIM